MKTAALLLCLLLAGSLAPGRVATNYIRIVVDPDFQYRTDQDVILPLQARVVRGGVPQTDLVHLELRDTNGSIHPIPGGQAWLNAGVAPYPGIAYVNLGRLEPGLYRVNFHAWTQDLNRDWPTEFDVVYPPKPYEAALEGTHGNQARFVFKAHEAADNFTLTMYRDTESGRIILEHLTTNHTTLDVPYIPGESVKIDVEDQNGWKNAENRFHDWQNGVVTYPPYTWNPDYKQIQNYQVRSWQNAITAAFVLAALGGIYVVARRRRQA
jgi:hypothetical protein